MMEMENPEVLQKHFLKRGENEERTRLLVIVKIIIINLILLFFNTWIHRILFIIDYHYAEVP